MAIGRITGQMLSSTLSRDTVDLTIATTGDSSLLHVDATNDRIGIGLNNPTVQFQTTGSAIVGTDLTVTGNLTVNGSTTTINTTNLTVDDKNIELAHSLSGQAPSDAAADGGGIILKGDTDHTILWSNSNNSWDFSENVSVATGSAFQINNSTVLDANNLTLENIQIAGNTITSASNADISLQPSGTGVVKLSGISIDGDVITSDDSTAVTIGENLNIDGTLSFNDGQGVSTISNDSTLAGNSSTALVTESAVKSYVDSVAGGTITLGDSSSNAGSVDINAGQDLEFRSGNSITLTVAGNGVTAALNKSIDVNEISSSDSTAIQINDGVNITGALNVASSLEIGNGPVITAILDEDTLSSNSDTAIPTQQSVKAYVDSQITATNTLTLADDTSTTVAIDLDNTATFAGGNSITTTVSGDGINIALDKSIDVNEISSTDSTAVVVNDGLNVNGNLDVGSAFTISNGTSITAILDEDTMASDSASALATQQSIKAYVDTEIAGLSQTIKFSDDTSSVVTIDMKNDTVSMAGGNSITSTISGDTITFALDKSIDVNEISSGDSTAIQINDAVNVSGALNTATSLEINNSTVVDGILDEDNMVSDSATKLATQQSIKAYVDAQVGANTITVIDDASSSVQINIANDDLQVAGGNSITTSISGDGVSVALDSDITVNSITSADSSFVKINDSVEAENAQINQQLTVDGNAQIKGNLTVQGTTTYIETTNTKVSDPLLLLNNGNSGGADIDSGIMVERGSAGNNAVLYWNEGDDRFKAVLTTADQDATTVTDDSYATMNLGGLVFGSESVVATSILDEDTMASDSATALATQQSIKAYVDTEVAGLSQTIKVSDDGSTVLTLDLKNDTMSLAGGNSITSSITGDTVTFALDKSIDVNEISSSDSTAIQINDGVNITGALNVASSLEIGNGPVVTAILDEDAMGSNSDTALATQQSIKAYVDNSISALSTTIKFADDGSTVLTADLQNDTISLAGGDSITSTISGDTVTFNLNDDITVNQIGAKDSSAVSITSPLQATTVQASGNVTVANDITLASGSITSASGTIDFGNENLTTTGNITATGATVTASALDVQTISSTDSTTILVNDGIRVEGASNFQSNVEVYGTLYTNFIAPEDSASISVQGNLGVDGNFDVGSNFTISNGVHAIDRILDEDDMNSNSATALVTQQSVKQYVDDQVAGVQISALNDIGNVDAQDGDLTDGDVLVMNDDSTNVFTISSQLTTALRVPRGSTAQRPSAYQGAIRFNSDTGQYEGCTDGSTFVAFAMAGNAESLTKDVFTGDGGATYNFSNISNPVEAGNSNGALGLIVYIDNVLQEPTQNYTITNTAITFDSVVHSGARIVAIQGFDGGAGGGAGGGLTQVENTDVDSAVEDLDTFATTLYRAVKYVYRVENAGTSEYQAGEILVVHDGSTAYLTEYAKISTGNNDLITFTTDVSGGNVRLRGSAQAPNSNFLAKKIVLSVV